MKLRYLFSTILASALLFVGCEPQTNLGGLDNITVSQSYLSIPVAGGSTQVVIDAKEAWAFEGTDSWPSSWLTASATSGAAGKTTVTFTADKVDGGREAEIAIKVGSYTQYIKVRQGSLAAELVTCAQVISGPDGKNFRVKGTCVSIANTTYGNWDLKDETGQIYIYGTLNADGEEKKFSELNIEVGDILEVEGPKTTYGSTVELVNVMVISHTKALIKIPAEPTVVDKYGKDVEIKVAYKGNGLFPSIKEADRSWIKLLGMEYKAGVPTKIEPNPADTAYVSFNVAPNLDPEAKARTAMVDFYSSLDGAEYSIEYEISQKGAAVPATAKEINAAPDGEEFILTGYVSKVANTKYGNLYITDATGEVYVYGTNDFAASGLKEGDIVKVQGPKSSYNGSPQLKNVTVKEITKVQDITVADFVAKEDSKTQYYRLTGKVTEVVKAEYGNINIQDATGTVYVYGVYKGYGATSSKGVWDGLGVKVGDEITIVGFVGSYKGTKQVADAFYVSHKAASEDDGKEDKKYAISLAYKLGANAYDDGVATVNGVADLKTVKLGTSSKVGDVTITVPAGTKKLVFNAVAWKGATAVATLKVGDSEIGKIENIAGNDGATGNAPYTITVENDTYTFSYDFKSETSVNVSTDKRVVIYGLKAE